MNIHSVPLSAVPRRDATPGPKRDAILRAAIDVFAERGFFNAQVADVARAAGRSEEHTSELQSQFHLVCRLLLEKKKKLKKHEGDRGLGNGTVAGDCRAAGRAWHSG